MNNKRLSLITPDAHTGLSLASELAERLHTQMQAANDRVERPGGMNYLLPPPVPKESSPPSFFTQSPQRTRAGRENLPKNAPRLCAHKRDAMIIRGISGIPRSNRLALPFLRAEAFASARLARFKPGNPRTVAGELQSGFRDPSIETDRWTVREDITL